MIKRYNNFNESNTISKVTGYGNTVMEHNDIYLDNIYSNLEETIDFLDELQTELDPLDIEFIEDEIQVTIDIEQIEDKSKKLRKLLNQALKISNDLKKISEKYIQY
ncbi:MAG: hypothetical protein HPY57_13270 [Ignavibacteria bacterium]|nr:hypothetical protein [Ignavibacteria bacterium]